MKAPSTAQIPCALYCAWIIFHQKKPTIKITNTWEKQKKTRKPLIFFYSFHVCSQHSTKDTKNIFIHSTSVTAFEIANLVFSPAPYWFLKLLERSICWSGTEVELRTWRWLTFKLPRLGVYTREQGVDIVRVFCLKLGSFFGLVCFFRQSPFQGFLTIIFQPYKLQFRIFFTNFILLLKTSAPKIDLLFCWKLVWIAWLAIVVCACHDGILDPAVQID
jgi:hypothetical protein